jgi:hypothetical protein
MDASKVSGVSGEVSKVRVEKKSVEKNYAPIDPRIANLEKDVVSSKVYDERQRRRQKIAEHQTPTANFDYNNRVTTREANAIAAIRRIGDKCECLGLSPYLKNNYTLGAEMRLCAYSRNHKCTHGLWFNCIRIGECKTKKHKRFFVSCDHAREVETECVAARCKRCGSKDTRMIERDCSCVVSRCLFCKVSTYKFLFANEVELSGVVCQCGEEQMVGSDHAEWLKKHVVNGKKKKSIWAKQQKVEAINLKENVVAPVVVKKRLSKIDRKKAQRMDFVEKQSGMEGSWSGWSPEKKKKKFIFPPRPSEPCTLGTEIVLGGVSTSVPKKEEKKPEVESQKVEKQGGVISTVSSACNSAYTKITEVMQLVKKFVCKTFKHIGSLTSDVYVRAKSFAKTLYITMKIEQLLQWFKDNPLLMSAMVANVTSIVISPSIEDSLLSIVSLISIIAGAIRAVKINLHASDEELSDNDIDRKVFCDILDASIDEIETATDAFTSACATPAGAGATKESGFSFSGLVDTFLSFFSNLFGFSSGSIKIASLLSMDYLKSFNIICTSRKNMGELIECFMNFLPQWIKCLFFASDSKTLIREHIKDNKTALGKVYESALAFKIAVETDASETEIRKLKDEAAADMVEWQRYMKDHMLPMDSNMLTLNRQLEAYISTMEKSKNREREPFTIKIAGASGVGKSTFWPILMSYLPEYEDVDDVKHIRDETYTRQIGDDFWSGYDAKRHKIILYDDFNQDREEKDLAEIIGLCSAAPFMPNMPSINPTDKNIGVKGTQVTSPYLVLLSNVSRVSPITLHSPEAINRRRHLQFQVDFKHTFDHTMTFDFSHALITVVYSRHQTKPSGPLTLAEACVFARDEYKSFIVAQNKLTINSNALLRKNADPIREKWWNRKPESDEPKTVKRESGISFYKFKANTYIKNMASGALASWAKAKDLAKYMWDRSTMMLYSGSCFLREILEICYKVSVCVVGVCIISSIVMRRGVDAVEVESGTTKTNKYIAKKVQAEGATDDVTNLLIQNTVKLHNSMYSQNGIFVAGNLLLTNEHFFLAEHDETTRYFAKGTKMSFYSPVMKEEVEFEFDPACIIMITKRDGGYKDAVLYKMPQQVASRRSIVKHFWDGTSNLANRKYSAVYIDKAKKTTVRVGNILEDNITIHYDTKAYGKTVSVEQHSTFVYDFRSQVGDCGMPILADDDAFPSKIIGIHVAGSPDGAYGMIITENQLLRAIAKAEEIFGVTVIRQGGFRAPTLSEIEDINVEGKLTAYAVLDSVIQPPMVSSIEPSPLFDKIVVHSTIPARLDVREADRRGVDIIRKGVNKYSHSSPNIEEDLAELVAENILQTVLSKRTISLRRPLTLDEAINGNDQYPFITALNMSTSAGYPWCTMPEYKGDKSKLFTRDSNDRYIPIPILLKQIEEVEAMFRKGIIPELPFVDCLKDERRPIEKVREDKTRLFSCCPLAVTIVARKYFLPYLAHIMQARLSLFSAVGINKNSVEWHKMYMYLASVGEVFAFDGDYTEFDGRLHKRLMKIHYDNADKFFIERTPLCSLARRTIALFMCESAHIFYCVKTRKCYVYLCNGGNPSGNNSTTMVNTESNEAALQLAWLHLAPVYMRDLYYYNLNVRTIIYGDDNVVCVSCDASKFFTARAIKEVFVRYGMKYGPADKMSEIGDFVHLEQCHFLKNATGEFFGWKVPLMDLTSLLETINWVRQGKNSPLPDKACEDNCNAVLRSLVFHGEKEFNKWRKAILREKPYYNLLQFRYLREEFQQTGSIGDPFNDDGCGVKSVKSKLDVYNLETLEHL